MQLIASPRAVRLPLGATVASVLTGIALLGGGLFLAWLAFTTPLVSALTPKAIRPTLPQMAIGGAVGGVALIAPPCFAIVGAWRLSRVVRALTIKPRPRALNTAAALLGDDFVAASDVRLPDGRPLHNVVIGPFGMAVLNELPPARFTRRTGTTWELRGAGGRWIHMENPLERAARDAERVRRWFSSVDRDYVLKVYAALISNDPTLGRSANCAVVTSDQVAAWLGSLPPARALTPDRRAELVEHVAQLL